MQHHRCSLGDCLVPGKVDLALGTDGDAKSGRAEPEHTSSLPSPVAQLVLTEVAFAVDTDEPAGVAIHLGDVERIAGPLGYAEDRADTVRQVASSSRRTGSASIVSARSG